MKVKLDITRQKWVDHKFNLGIDPGWSHNVITRISDIDVRCEHHCAGLSDEELSTRLNDKWSIKEHIGHLIDLEELHINRIIQFKNLKNNLDAADMSNKKTEASNHNDRSLKDLISELVTEREELIRQFQALNEECMNHAAMHPRLKVEMKPVDLMFFVGEHDDHHLTSIRKIKKKLID